MMGNVFHSATRILLVIPLVAVVSKVVVATVFIVMPFRLVFRHDSGDKGLFTEIRFPQSGYGQVTV